MSSAWERLPQAASAVLQGSALVSRAQLHPPPTKLSTQLALPGPLPAHRSSWWCAASSGMMLAATSLTP